MKLARWVFFSAGVFGFALILPLAYSLLSSQDSMFPAGATGLAFYGYVFQFTCWQILYFLVSTDPARYRPLMIPALLAMITTPLFPVWAYVYGIRFWPAILVLTGVLACLFVLAFWLTKAKRIVGSA